MTTYDDRPGPGPMDDQPVNHPVAAPPGNDRPLPEAVTTGQPDLPMFYYHLGGSTAVTAVIDDFYAHVLDDPPLAPYFDGVELPKLKRHMVVLLTKVLGGPDSYAGRDLHEAHKGLGITDEHYTRVGYYLLGVLWEHGAGVDGLMHMAEVLADVKSQIVTAGVPDAEAA